MPQFPPRVAVVGAGIVGACIAYELRRRGAVVTLFDRDVPGGEAACSFGNSGALSPGSVAPVAMPGIVGSLPGMLGDPESPLHLRWRHLPFAAPWLVRFVRSATPAGVDDAARRLAGLYRDAIERHAALTRELGVPDLLLRAGHLHLYPDDTALAKDAGGWALRERHGYAVQRLDRDGLLALEPATPARYRIGLFLADHATIRDPARYVRAVVGGFVARGGTLRRAEVRALVRSSHAGWRIETPDAEDFDHVVVAAGAWSDRLLAPLGARVELESQRGYHVQFTGRHDVVSRTVVLADRKVFLAPMEGGLRAGGTVEIAGLAAPPDWRRAAVIERIVREAFPAVAGAPVSRWMGHRPCRPDSVPVVGPAPGQPGLWRATGHGHLGLTGSVNAARQIADALISG